jgi:hypothetical protein
LDRANGTTLQDSARTLELTLRAVGHGLQALRQRVCQVEHEAAGLRALAGFLAARRAHREPEPVAPVQRVAA